MRTYLSNLGFSGYEIDRLIDAFGSPDKVISLLGSENGRKELSSVVESSSVKLCHSNFCRTWLAKKLYEKLSSSSIPEDCIYRFFIASGEDEDMCLKLLEADPYRLVFEVKAPFPSVDALAKTYGLVDSFARTKAAVYSTLLLAENGSEDASDEDISSLAGSTCLPADKLISISESLLGDTASDEIIAAAKRLHFEKKILLTKKDLAGEKSLVAMRPEIARCEFDSAKAICRMLSADSLRYDANPYEVIDASQAALGLYLSHEQVNAVYQSLTHRISVITGGPGTGKTQTLKVLLETFRRLSGGKAVQLMAPTGQAAQRMETATGYSASTVHKALGIFPGETDPDKAFDISSDLIVCDEASMIDASLFSLLLKHLKENAILVIVGDVDQLPSIGAGNTLAELIACVPTARLTKIFRQDGDAADIAHNAARIKAGSSKMIESNRFSYVKASGSADIQKAVCNVYAKEVEEAGLENVIVLTPLRRKTKTGVNQLNQALRKTCSDSKRYISYAGNRIYLNDKVIFLKNRYGLSNGSQGFVTKVGKDGVEATFGDKKITLSGSQLTWITPAYAETIHKSQGDEYKVVIIVADEHHPVSKPLMYTAITRSRDKAIIVGQPSVLEKACKTQGGKRYSLLSSLVKEGEA